MLTIKREVAAILIQRAKLRLLIENKNTGRHICIGHRNGYPRCLGNNAAGEQKGGKYSDEEFFHILIILTKIRKTNLIVDILNNLYKASSIDGSQ